MLNPKPKLFYAACQESQHALPLSPLIHCLRRDVPAEVWERLDSHWLERLCVLLPELSIYCEDSEISLQANFFTGEQNLFDAIHHALILTAETFGRLFFIFDDAQWADRYTFQAINYLTGEGFFDRYGLLTIVARTLEPNNDLQDFLARINRKNPVTTISLTGLDQKELTDLAEQVLGEPPPNFLMEKLYKETHGNPFVTLEFIREIQNSQENIENFGPSSELLLPATIQALVIKRLNHFDELSREILLVGAVLGNDFTLETLHKLLNESKEAVVASVDKLIGFGFLVVDPQEHSRTRHLQFTHEKIKDVVLRESSTLQRQHLHEQVAEILSESDQSETNAAVIANHFLSGSQISKAFKWLLKAAQYDWTLGARDEVLRNFEKAEGLIRNPADSLITREQTIHLYRLWIEFAYQSNQIAMLEKLGVKLQYLGEHDPDPLVLGISQIALSNACFLRNEFEPGYDLIQNALDNLEKTDHPRLYCQALYRKGALSWWLLKFHGIPGQLYPGPEDHQRAKSQSERRRVGFFSQIYGWYGLLRPGRCNQNPPNRTPAW